MLSGCCHRMLCTCSFPPWQLLKGLKLGTVASYPIGGCWNMVLAVLICVVASCALCSTFHLILCIHWWLWLVSIWLMYTWMCPSGLHACQGELQDMGTWVEVINMKPKHWSSAVNWVLMPKLLFTEEENRTMPTSQYYHALGSMGCDLGLPAEMGNSPFHTDYQKGIVSCHK